MIFMTYSGIGGELFAHLFFLFFCLFYAEIDIDVSFDRGELVDVLRGEVVMASQNPSRHHNVS